LKGGIKMKIWTILTIALVLVAFAGIAVTALTSDSPTETTPQGCGACNGGCTAESNCGLAGCGATQGGNCGCSK
jgi:flagellar basal body-associated protein FliL